MKTLYYTLVYAYFHYCNIIWANNYPSRLTRIEILQKRAVRIIAKIQYRDSTVNFFKELKILKIKEINELEMSLFMFKLYNNQVPINLTGVFSVNSQIHSLHGMQMTIIFHANHPDLTSTLWPIKVQKYGIV